MGAGCGMHGPGQRWRPSKPGACPAGQQAGERRAGRQAGGRAGAPPRRRGATRAPRRGATRAPRRGPHLELQLGAGRQRHLRAPKVALLPGHAPPLVHLRENGRWGRACRAGRLRACRPAQAMVASGSGSHVKSAQGTSLRCAWSGGAGGRAGRPTMARCATRTAGSRSSHGQQPARCPPPPPLRSAPQPHLPVAQRGVAAHQAQHLAVLDLPLGAEAHRHVAAAAGAAGRHQRPPRAAPARAQRRRRGLGTRQALASGLAAAQGRGGTTQEGSTRAACGCSGASSVGGRWRSRQPPGGGGSGGAVKAGTTTGPAAMMGCCQPRCCDHQAACCVHLRPGRCSARGQQLGRPAGPASRRPAVPQPTLVWPEMHAGAGSARGRRGFAWGLKHGSQGLGSA